MGWDEVGWDGAGYGEVGRGGRGGAWRERRGRMGEGWLGGRDGMGAEVARRHTCNRSVEDVEDVPAPRGLEVERGCGPLSPAPWTHAAALVCAPLRL